MQTSSKLGRTNSDSSLDKVWLPVVEQNDAYSQYLGELYNTHSIPIFLNDIFNMVATPPHRGMLYDSDGVPLYCTIDITSVNGIALGGWFMRLNPRYHNVDVKINAASIVNSFRYVAWWVPPKYYTSSFKEWLASDKIKVDSSVSSDVSRNNGSTKRDICSNYTYFSTPRDVPESFRAAVFGDLLAGARAFIESTYGIGKFEDTSCDFHYPSQFMYSSLHCQIRHKSIAHFTDEERSTRYGLQEIIKCGVIMPDSIEYSICCNSYHSIWMAINQHRIPWRLKRVCGDLSSHILHIGLQKRIILPHRTVISLSKGSISLDAPHSAALQSHSKVKVGVIMNEGKYRSLGAAWEGLSTGGCEVVYLGDEDSFNDKEVDKVDKLLYTIRSQSAGERLFRCLPQEKLLEKVKDVELCSDRLEFNKLLQAHNIPYGDNIESNSLIKVTIAGHHISISSFDPCKNCEVFEIDSDICRQIELLTHKIAISTGLLFFGIDFMTRAGTKDLFVVGINHFPTYKGLEEDLYLSILEQIGIYEGFCAVIGHRIANKLEPSIGSRGSRWKLYDAGSVKDNHDIYFMNDLNPANDSADFSIHLSSSDVISDLDDSQDDESIHMRKKSKTEHFNSFLARCVSSISKDIDNFYVLEKPNAYKDYLYPQYMSAKLPSFLSDIIEGNAKANLSIVINNYTIIDSSLGCWILMPNPKYHPPNIEIDFKKCICFVAWWISPRFVTANDLRARVEAVARTRPLEGDFSDGFQPSHLMKASVSADEPYLCTIRDVKTEKAMQSICDLYAGAERFFKSNYGFNMDMFAQKDCHFPPGAQYGTLHFHFRREATMSGEDLQMRHPILSMINVHPDGKISPNPAYFKFDYQFEYPHHSGRALAPLLKQNAIPNRILQYGARTFIPKYPIIEVGDD